MGESGQRHAQRRAAKRKFTTSRFKGVHRYARPGRWQAKIKVNGVVRHLGYFRDVPLAERTLVLRLRGARGGLVHAASVGRLRLLCHERPELGGQRLEYLSQ